jgi:hypothetical protein
MVNLVSPAAINFAGWAGFKVLCKSRAPQQHSLPVVLSRSRIICGSAPVVGDKQWIGQIAVAMSAAAAVVDFEILQSWKKWAFVRGC